MKSIAIMQPTFLPWIGYFALIDRVDEFVFLDHVQFDKRSWQQRNKIKTPNGPTWLSIPVSTKGKQTQTIQETEILYEGSKTPFDKMIKSIEHSYSKTPFYKEYANHLYDIFAQKPVHISQLNQDIIHWVCKELNITTPFIRSSDLNTSGNKDILLVNICKNRQATDYISPPGSKAYLDQSDAFDEANINLLYHTYNHPEYNQPYGDFEPYMGIIDLLFNEGPNSITIIKQGLI